MTKHVPRSARWTRLNAKEYRADFGVVRYRAGAWEGTVMYEARDEDPAAPWRAETASAGRFKRPRNAMISVEDKAREIRRRQGDNARVAIAD